MHQYSVRGLCGIGTEQYGIDRPYTFELDLDWCVSSFHPPTVENSSTRTSSFTNTVDRRDTARPTSSGLFAIAALLRVRDCPDTKPNRKEKFNADIFRRLGDLGLLGVTVPEEYGGSGMDATAACIVHEELSAADPACCLSYLGECRAVSQGFGGSGVRLACAQ